MGLAPELPSIPSAPVWDVHCRVLVLGSVSLRAFTADRVLLRPSAKPLLARAGAPLWPAVPPDTAGRRSFVLRHGLALWDVLAACDIVGSSDASIRHAVPNDVPRCLRAVESSASFATGNGPMPSTCAILMQPAACRSRRFPPPARPTPPGAWSVSRRRGV